MTLDSPSIRETSDWLELSERSVDLGLSFWDGCSGKNTLEGLRRGISGKVGKGRSAETLKNLF
jgi:hypothetical protein